jgi:hypothetical protein
LPSKDLQVPSYGCRTHHHLPPQHIEKDFSFYAKNLILIGAQSWTSKLRYCKPAQKALLLRGYR